ncbi:unnamed protein product [Haemonchus placei]|uniref:PINIT domain-containing protein n=1 Tax=Haemonchus placei TaxID=6290 RepID=A0A0N4VV65_HAEPC|nr:unnamed protein product [Haemonchus placei]
MPIADREVPMKPAAPNSPPMNAENNVEQTFGFDPPRDGDLLTTNARQTAFEAPIKGGCKPKLVLLYNLPAMQLENPELPFKALRRAVPKKCEQPLKVSCAVLPVLMP